MDQYRVTAVCLGNICRSPMAEAVLRAKFAAAGLSDRVAVDSAGTAGWHEGKGADPRAVATLEAASYPQRHVARQYRAGDRTDLVLAMDESNLRDLRRVSPAADIRLLRSFDPAADGTEVPDPYYGGPEGFVEVLRMVEAAADGVVAHVAGQLAQHP